MVKHNTVTKTIKWTQHRNHWRQKQRRRCANLFGFLAFLLQSSFLAHRPHNNTAISITIIIFIIIVKYNLKSTFLLFIIILQTFTFPWFEISDAYCINPQWKEKIEEKRNKWTWGKIELRKFSEKCWDNSQRQAQSLTLWRRWCNCVFQGPQYFLFLTPNCQSSWTRRRSQSSEQI